MKHLLINLRAFCKNDRLIFIVLIVCVISSAFIINFSYGLYYNYNCMKYEVEVDMNDVYPEIAEGKTLTKKDLQNYVESLDKSTLDNMTVICAQGKLDECPPTDEEWPTMFSRFVIRDGEYNIAVITRDNWMSRGLITYGRYISDDEEARGADVAMVYINADGIWKQSCENLRNEDGSITLFGKKYKVIGGYAAGGGTPIVPFLSIPDDYCFISLGMTFEKNINSSEYNELKNKAEEVIPGILVYPALDFPDKDDIALYNNMIIIAVVISVLAMINFAMLYHYVITKRRRRVAVMRMCGCTVSKAAALYLCECTVITVPSYIVGWLINALLVKYVFSDFFEFMAKAYTPAVPFILFAAFIAVFLIIIVPTIYKTINRTILEEWRGR